MSFTAEGLLLESRLLCSSKGNESKMEFFAGKTFSSILQSDQILLLYLTFKVPKAAVIAEVTIETIIYLRVVSILCDSLNTPAIICLK